MRVKAEDLARAITYATYRKPPTREGEIMRVEVRNHTPTFRYDERTAHEVSTELVPIITLEAECFVFATCEMLEWTIKI